MRCNQASQVGIDKSTTYDQKRTCAEGKENFPVFSTIYRPYMYNLNITSTHIERREYISLKRLILHSILSVYLHFTTPKFHIYEIVTGSLIRRAAAHTPHTLT